MESYLIGNDLWELICEKSTNPPIDPRETTKWNAKVDKAIYTSKLTQWMTESDNAIDETLSRIEEHFMRSVGTRLQWLEEYQTKRPLEVEHDGEISKNQRWEEGGLDHGRKKEFEKFTESVKEKVEQVQLILRNT